METKARDFLEELNAIEEPQLPAAIPEETPEELRMLPSLSLFSPLERKVIEFASQGNRPKDISLKLALPLTAVEAILCRPDVQDHLVLLSEAMNQLELMRLKGLYQEAIESRVEKALESGDASDISRKDTLDIMKAYQDLLLAERKGKGPQKEQDIFVNILNQVMG